MLERQECTVVGHTDSGVVGCHLPLQTTNESGEQPLVQRHAEMTWAQRLKRVFSIDVERCRICGGSAKVIACIEDPVVIKKILMHLEEKLPTRAALQLPNNQAPPRSSLFG